MNTKYYKRILAFMFPILYSPNEPEDFLGFFTSSIRIRICPCGSGRPFLMWIRNTDLDPHQNRTHLLAINYRYGTGTGNEINMFFTSVRCDIQNYIWPGPTDLCLLSPGLGRSCWVWRASAQSGYLKHFKFSALYF